MLLSLSAKEVCQSRTMLSSSERSEEMDVRAQQRTVFRMRGVKRSPKKSGASTFCDLFSPVNKRVT
jgi:hypothetical protein